MKRVKILLVLITIISLSNLAMIFYYMYIGNNELEVNEAEPLYETVRTSAEVPEIMNSEKSIQTNKAEDSPSLDQRSSVNGQSNLSSLDTNSNEKNFNIPILIYHAFEDIIPKDDKYGLYVTPDRFEENIKTLLEAGYTFITFDDLYDYEKGIKILPEKNIMITIDDGYLNNYTHAYPILKKHNVKANIFIITELTGGLYMNWDQIREMYESGLVKFYSHGKKHIDYTTVSLSKLKKDILESHETIEKELGAGVLKVFAYPYGICNKSTKDALKSVGFEIQVLTKYGTVNKSDKLALTDIGRIKVENNTTGKRIISIIEQR